MENDYAISLNAGVLLGVAKAAYERTSEAVSDRASQGTDALVSVVFSALALEAFVNEMAAMADMPAPHPEPASVATFVRGWKEIEEKRGSTEAKFMLASEVFAGNPYDKGAPPYQDFSDLMFLRNALVHLRPVERLVLDRETRFLMPVEPHDALKRLRNKSVLDESGEPFVSWISRITTRAVAHWACNTAVQMVRSILHMLPESRLRRQVEQQVYVNFRSVT
jgi:hypothetical protein